MSARETSPESLNEWLVRFHKDYRQLGTDEDWAALVDHVVGLVEMQGFYVPLHLALAAPPQPLTPSQEAVVGTAAATQILYMRDTFDALDEARGVHLTSDIPRPTPLFTPSPTPR